MKRVLELFFVLGFVLYGIFAINWLQEYRGDLTVVESASASAEIVGEDLTDSAEDTLFAAVNDYRVANGLAPLAKNAELCTSASAKAIDMKQKDYFAHISPQGQNFDAFFSADFQHNGAAENLAMVSNDISTSLSLWQGSPSHNAAMLGDYNASCISFSMLDAVNYSGADVHPYVVVQHFAKI